MCVCVCAPSEAIYTLVSSILDVVGVRFFPFGFTTHLRNFRCFDKSIIQIFMSFKTAKVSVQDRAVAGARGPVYSHGTFFALNPT